MVADPPLVVDPDDIAVRLGLTLPLSEADQRRVELAILDAQADVEAYLGRTIYPAEYVETGLWPQSDGSWALCNYPVVTVVSAVEETSEGGQPLGTYTVTYTAGLDAANDVALLPIRRFVSAAAMNSPMVLDLWRAARSDGGRIITSLSTEGQSIGYKETTVLGTGTLAAGAAGSIPTLDSLDRWSLRGKRVFQRRDPGTYDWTFF